MSFTNHYYVYILQCNDGSYYTGITNNIERRLAEHNSGTDISCYTYARRPVVTRFYEQFTDIRQAIAREKQIKRWGRKKKEALFMEDWELLKILSRNNQR